MTKPKNDYLYDSRLVERHIQTGLLTREQYQKWLDAQEDISGHGQPITASQEDLPSVQ